MEYQVDAVDTSRETVCMFGLSDAGMARESVNLLLEKGVRTAAAFAGDDSQGYKYVLGSRSADVRPAGKALNEKFAGRGGGKPEMVQGSIAGTRQEIEQFVETLEMK